MHDMQRRHNLKHTLLFLLPPDCDENSNPFEEMSGVFHENFTTKVFNGNDINCTNNNQPGGISKKRKLEETMDATGEGLFVRGKYAIVGTEMKYCVIL